MGAWVVCQLKTGTNPIGCCYGCYWKLGLGYGSKTWVGISGQKSQFFGGIKQLGSQTGCVEGSCFWKEKFSLVQGETGYIHCLDSTDFGFFFSPSLRVEGLYCGNGDGVVEGTLDLKSTHSSRQFSHWESRVGLSKAF